MEEQKEKWYRCMTCKKIGKRRELEGKYVRTARFGHCNDMDLQPINEPMEQWEVDLRNELNEKLEDGYYQIGPYCEGGMVVGTGKGGKIEFEVSFHKHIRQNDFHLEIIKELEENKGPVHPPLTLEKLKSVLSNLINKPSSEKGTDKQG